MKATDLRIALIKVVVGCTIFSTVLSHAAQEKAGAFNISERRAVKQNLELTTGIQKTVDLNFDPCPNLQDCVRVTNSDLFKIQYSKDKRQLIFTPVKDGDTTVTIRDQNGDIRLILNTLVLKANLSRRIGELKHLLRDVEGIEIKPLGDKILVDGEVVVMNDLNRLYAVLSDESYKSFVLNLVGLSPLGMQVLAEKIQAEINNPGIRVRILNSLFVVEGQVDNIDQANTALDVARNMIQGFLLPNFNYEGRNPFDVKKTLTKDPVVPRITIAKRKDPPPPKLIRITVDFVELSKDYLRNFGFSWIPSLETGGSVAFGQGSQGGVTTEGTGSLSGTIGNLFPKLNSAQNAGYARILEEAVLVVKEGAKVALDRQTRIPVQSTNAQTGQINYQGETIGPKLSIVPNMQGEEDIELNIDFNYKGLVGQSGGAPITQNHNYVTVLAVRNGQSAAVVNAISNVVTTNFNKDPPGGKVPENPLFTLLRSKAFQKNKSQFVIFVTPQVIESASGGTEDIKAKYGLKRKQ